MARRYPEMNLRNADGSGRGSVRHVSATISRVFPDRASHDGAEHQHIWIDAVSALDGGADYAGNVFVAIRITNGGIGHDIAFAKSTPIELQGDWIPADEATAGQDDPGLPVLHFTHKPVGFVLYDGTKYA